MGAGWITINRDIRNSWLWDKSPVKSYFEAWTDMLLSASIKENKILINGDFVILERGQLAWSLRFMAKRWGWTVKKVRVFIQKLEKNESILGHSRGTAKGTQKGTGITVITICNYRQYQDIKTGKGTAKGNSEDQKRAQQGHSRGTNRTSRQANKEQRSLKSLGDKSPVSAKKPYSGDFEGLWKKYPKRAGGNSKQDARTQYNARIKTGITHATLEAGLDRYINYCQQADILGTREVRMAATWFGVKGAAWTEDWLPPRQTKTDWRDQERQKEIDEQQRIDDWISGNDSAAIEGEFSHV